MLLGVHVSTEGKIYEALNRAYKLGCNTMQIFARNPQQWRDNSLAEEDITEFRNRRERYKINPVFVHIPYLINLASPNPKLYEGSIEAYIEDIFEAHALNADYIITHMGSHKETSEDAGIKRLITALDTILKKTSDVKVGILLENTSGSGSWLGYKFIHHKRIINGLKKYKTRLGICFDTAHAYCAGYDIATEDGLEGTLNEIDKLFGLNMLKVIHLNDTRDALDSRRDRHEHIGRGRIGLEGMRRIINHPGLRNLPFMLETPKDTEQDDIINLRIVRKLRRD
jgi:deoxyribonuclease-4